MALVDWQEDFMVDNGPLDAQHRVLVEIINKFEEAAGRGRDPRILEEIVNDLMGYTQEHFAFEENIMAEAGFPQLKRHQDQHRQLLQKLEKFQFEFTSQGRQVTEEMRDFLKSWLTSHILKDDKAFASECVLGKT